MTDSRPQARPATAKRSGAGKTIVVKALGSTAFAGGAEDFTEISVSKARFGRIATKRSAAGKVLAGYADTAAKAKRTGKAFVIAYKVTPDGKVEPVPAAPSEKTVASGLEAAIARAKGRGATKAADILKGGDMLTARDFGPLIGASHETVNAKRKRFEVLGLEGATRGVKYPRWQVTEAGLPLPGLARVFGVLGKAPWTVYRFLRTAHAELGGSTALEALKAGQVDAVVGVAENQVAGAFS